MKPIQLSPESLLGQSHRSVQLGEPVMSADGDLFKHPNPDLTAFRSRVPIYCGDLELKFWQVERSAYPNATLKDFSISWLLIESTARNTSLGLPTATYVNEELLLAVCELSEDPEPQSHTPAALIFELANFGCLMWDWGKLSLRAGVPIRADDSEHDAYMWGSTMTNARGERFYARGFASATPELRTDGVDALYQQAIAYLDARDTPMMGLPRARVHQIIAEDCETLRAICAAHGCFGAALTPDAFDPISSWLILGNDGNYRTVLFETERFWSAFYLLTS